MAEDENEIKPEPDELPGGEPETRPKRRFTRRRLLKALGVAAAVLAVASVILLVLFRTGVVDGYVKDQLTVKLTDIGIKFESDDFGVTMSPFEAELRNATFSDKTTGEKLFFIRDLRLGLTVLDLLSWKLSRDISIDSSDVSGAEVWVKFDENGRSNFSNLKFIEDEKGSTVNFRYDSTRFTLQDSVIHFGDVSRKVSANANNLTVSFGPDEQSGVLEKRRYKFDLYSRNSDFAYEDRSVENIGIRAIGTADNTGADITKFELSTPLGDSHLSGTIRDWAAPKYEFDVESTIDITQISNIFATGTALRGVGNFRGRISGTGETYHVDGTAEAQALRAAGVYLKAVNVEATVEGSNSNYEANGKAVAEMLTFEDFQIDFPKMAGNVRGTGTDFRWVGELQAIAAKSPTLSLGGLFLSDAMAEYKDRKFRAEVGSGRAQRFAIGDTEFEDLRARNLKFTVPGGKLDLSSRNATAKSYVTKDYKLNGISGQNVRVRSAKGETSVDIRGVRSERAETKDARVRDVSARELTIKARLGSAELTATDLRAARVEANGTTVDGIESPFATLQDTKDETVIYSDKMRVAKIDTGSAVLGSLNIAGVRLTIRRGTIEGRSDDIDAGDIALTKSASLPNGGQLDAVRFNRPVFVLERSGRYRATADMSIGGGVVGNISLGSASARVNINNDRLLLDELNAKVMDGDVTGAINIARSPGSLSRIDADLAGVDLSKLAALQTGRVIPIEGKTTGNLHLTFQGTNYRTTSGTLSLNIDAKAGSGDSERIPVSGNIELTADNGLFSVSNARLFTGKSELTAKGRFDLQNEASNLEIALRSDDAAEIRRLFEVTGTLPQLDRQIKSMQVEFAGGLRFDGTITGNLFDPVVDGKASVDSVVMRGRELGSLVTNINASPSGVELRDGRLADKDGGRADFSVLIPYGGSNNVSVSANLFGINAGKLLAALPIDLPERISDLNGKTSGTVDITGLPDQAVGSLDLSSTKGTIAGQDFDSLKARAVFRGTRIDLEAGEIRVGTGSVSVKGMYDRQSTAFDLDVTGRAVPLPLLLAVLPKNDSIPAVTGLVDLTAKAVGESDRPATFDINFSGTARNVIIGESPFGDVLFSGMTANSVLNADLMANLEGRQQVINATLRFNEDDLPFSVTTSFDQSPMSPYLAFVPQLKGVPVTGTGTGRIVFGGKLRKKDNEKFVYTAANLSGTAEFSQLALTVQETPLNAAEPIKIRFNTREVVFESAKFSGGGSNMTISGTKALADDAINDLAIDGRINLSLLNLAKTDIFFAGAADLAVRLTGPNQTSRLTGTASTENASVATFIGADRLTFDRVKTRVIFTSNQAEIQDASGYLGGGRFTGSGGALLKGIAVQTFRVNVSGDNVTVPLPKDFMTTGDARLEITGIRKSINDNIQITIGGRVYAKRSLYSKDIDLANVIGGRRETTLSAGTSSVSAPRFDLVIEGKDALIVRNNIADLTASVSLTLTGDANNPQLSGRISANRGSLFYRKDRYEIQRAVLEFPPDTDIEPIINLQAETEIGGYQIFINLVGPLTDTELLTATLRSSPALPQADVVSLVTTGSLANTAGGIPTLAQTGINTAAEVLTDSIINNPARRATDKLFGLNVFEIDPIISGRQLNPSARLTVGRQINNNLRVTYSTNLSQDQNQVLALEYRVSNKLSFVAQYEQRSLSNVTRNRDNFSFEIRIRKRF